MSFPGFLARRISVTLACDERSVTFRYQVDEHPPAILRAAVGRTAPTALPFLAAAGAAYLGSLVLAREVSIHHPVRPALLDDLRPIVEMLYDIRRWRDQLPLGGPPALAALADRGTSAQELPPLDAARSVLAWSGGKDSTYALLALRANGHDPHPVHATINAGAESPEREAVHALADLLDVPEVEHLDVSHPEFLELTNRYADAWDVFPMSNRVPFGRDLLLYTLCVPVALRVHAANLSLGHDHECRNAHVLYRGKSIPRNDLESSRAAILLETAVQRHVHPELRLLPPIARLPELRILRDMLRDHPQLMARSSFCFWGRNCGRCSKCLRYFLADRLYRPGVLRFEVNPLAAGACPELGELLDDRDVLFHKEVMVLLGRVLQRYGIQEGEEELERFAASRMAEVEPHLDGWEADLLAEYDDPQVPEHFTSAVGTALSLPSAVTAG